ncbi:uncharacterized protein [Procambarus clarkii]|uniref:uncharacterized protein isoform X3 n=1 Tax=Procambarus clarkii TaxID=6728 RepID=UPI001E67069A|nr:uncharacterized protein LOC123763717 isoform X2 [Procambarus clarkii]
MRTNMAHQLEIALMKPASVRVERLTPSHINEKFLIKHNISWKSGSLLRKKLTIIEIKCMSRFGRMRKVPSKLDDYELLDKNGMVFINKFRKTRLSKKIVKPKQIKVKNMKCKMPDETQQAEIAAQYNLQSQQAETAAQQSLQTQQAEIAAQQSLQTQQVEIEAQHNLVAVEAVKPQLGLRLQKSSQQLRTSSTEPQPCSQLKEQILSQQQKTKGKLPLHHLNLKLRTVTQQQKVESLQLKKLIPQLQYDSPWRWKSYSTGETTPEDDSPWRWKSYSTGETTPEVLDSSVKECEKCKNISIWSLSVMTEDEAKCLSGPLSTAAVKEGGVLHYGRGRKQCSRCSFFRRLQLQYSVKEKNKKTYSKYFLKHSSLIQSLEDDTWNGPDNFVEVKDEESVTMLVDGEDLEVMDPLSINDIFLPD